MTELFKPCDNKIITEDEKKKILEKLEKQFKGILETMLFDTNDSNLKETPKRIAKAWFLELLSGRYVEKPKITVFPNENNIDVSNRIWFATILGTQFIGRTSNNSPLRYKNLKMKELDDIDKAFMNKNSEYISDCYMINNFTRSKNTKSIIIAEGIFDIIPIFMKRKKYRLTDSAIYSACLGCDYSRPIKVYKNIFMSFPKFITVFADVGIKYEDIKSKISKVMAGRKFNLEIHYPMVKDWNEAGPIKYSKKF